MPHSCKEAFEASVRRRNHRCLPVPLRVIAPDADLTETNSFLIYTATSCNFFLSNIYYIFLVILNLI